MPKIIEMTVAQACEIGKADPSTLRQAIANGRLPARKVGHMWLIRRDQLDVWLATRRRGIYDRSHVIRTKK